MTRRAFLIWMACIAAWNAFLGQILLKWAIVDAVEVNDPTANVTRLLIVLLIIWLMFFPAFRLLVRKRLLKRDRKTWWASLPGALVLTSVIIMFLPALFDLMANSAYISGFIRSFNMTALALTLLAPALLGLILGIGLIFECLRPDRIIDDPEIFQ